MGTVTERRWYDRERRDNGGGRLEEGKDGAMRKQYGRSSKTKDYENAIRKSAAL